MRPWGAATGRSAAVSPRPAAAMDQKSRRWKYLGLLEVRILLRLIPLGAEHSRAPCALGAVRHPFRGARNGPQTNAAFDGSNAPAGASMFICGIPTGGRFR